MDTERIAVLVLMLRCAVKIAFIHVATKTTTVIGVGQGLL